MDLVLRRFHKPKETLVFKLTTDRLWEIFLSEVQKWYSVKPGILYGDVKKHKQYFDIAVQILNEQQDAEYKLPQTVEDWGGVNQDSKAWVLETMLIINKLTPDIKGRAFNLDWFLLRQRLELAARRFDKISIGSEGTNEIAAIQSAWADYNVNKMSAGEFACVVATALRLDIHG
jgi:hypothetical protein